MSKAPLTFGTATPPSERKPARPGLVRVWLRIAVLVCFTLALSAPLLEPWAGHPQVLVREGPAGTAAGPLDSVPGRLSAWLFDSPAYAVALGVSLGGSVALLAELVVAAGWIVYQRRALDAAECTYLRIRPLRPQSRKASRAPADPAALWSGLHAALLQKAPSGPPPWVAFTLHARPDEPAALGALLAAGTRTGAGCALRQSLGRAVTTMLLGQDAETVVDEVSDPLRASLRPGMVLCWRELRLARPPHFPIRTPADIAGDTLGPLAASLKAPPGVVYAELQVIVRPRPDSDLQTPWRMFARRRYLALRRNDALGAAGEAQALEAKLNSEAFDISVRIVAVAQDRAHTQQAHSAIRALSAAFGQYQARGVAGKQAFRTAWAGDRSAVVPCAAPPAANDRALAAGMLAGVVLAALGMALAVPAGLLAAVLGLNVAAFVAGRALLAHAPIERAAKRTPRIAPLPAFMLPARLWAPPMILSGAEAAGLWHLPGVELKTLISWLPNRYLPAQPHTFIPEGAADRITLGYAARGDGSEAPVGPSLRALRQVLHVTAGMGAGKTRAAANMAHQLVPNGFFQLDGKGDDLGGSLAATTLTYIPLEDESRLVLVDVLDAEWPVGLNPLHGIDASAPGGMTQTLGMIMSVFARLDPETWSKSQGMQQYAQMGAALVAETVEHPTLANLKQALEDERYRATLLPACTNIEVRNFWQVTFPQVGEQQKSSRDALLRRLDNLMVDETTRYLLTQPTPTVDFLDCMQQGRIVIIPLPHRTLGGVAEFVGMLLLQAVIRAAFRRPGSDQTRATVPLIIDELQIFIGKGDSKDIQDAITQLRGFGIGGAYFHQALAQLGALRDEMLTNSASRLILRTQEPDASAYARQFPTTDLTPADISGQNFNDHQYAIFAGGDGPPEVCSIRPCTWPAPLDVDAGVPPYHGPHWQSCLPAPDADLAPAEREPGAESLEALIARLVYGEIDAQYVAAQLALLPADEWAYLCRRWDAIRAHQRAHIIANPGCIPFDERITHADPEQQAAQRRADRRRRRQQWLSRLDTRTPRIFAAAAYQRQRWAFAKA